MDKFSFFEAKDVCPTEGSSPFKEDLKNGIDSAKLLDELKNDTNNFELAGSLQGGIDSHELLDALRDNSETYSDGNETGEQATSEDLEKEGGSYADVKKNSDGETQEVHHMPADSASDLPREDGPAIVMDREDHRQTASCGNSRDAIEYRAAQRDLIEQGKFAEAVQMDIDDLHEKFGDKYDSAIAEMQDYVKKLEEEDRV